MQSCGSSSKVSPEPTSQTPPLHSTNLLSSEGENPAALRLVDFIATDKPQKTAVRFCCSIRRLCKCFSGRKYKITSYSEVPTGVLLPPQAPDKVGKKTLVLDLDETLIHSAFSAIPNPDMIVIVKIDGKDVFVYVKKRPGVDEFLKRASELYELVTFTASLTSYANPVLDKLDPHHYISHRLFREHCVQHHGEFVKDLSRLGRNMSDVVILDNSPSSYQFHPNNGMPIKSFINDERDEELPEALNLLREMSSVEDIPEFLNPHRQTLLRRATDESQLQFQNLLAD